MAAIHKRKNPTKHSLSRMKTRAGIHQESVAIRTMHNASKKGLCIADFPDCKLKDYLKTKDKGKYRVEAITVPIKDEVGYNDTLGFYDSNSDALADRYIISYKGNEVDDIKEIEEQDFGKDASKLNNEGKKLIVIPQAYRSLEIKNNTGTPVENNDKGSSFVQCQLFAKDNAHDCEPKSIGNATISLCELGLSDDPTVWHVNDNNGHFYMGDYSANGLGDP